MVLYSMTLIRVMLILTVQVIYFSRLIATRYSSGDTEVDTFHDRVKRQVIGDDKDVWLKHLVNNDKEATVNYYFDRKTSDATREAFLRAAKAWERDTCINFTENENATDVIHVVEWDKLCASNIGKVGGPQNLSLGKGCDKFGHAYHEIGHALGLHHAQNRYDRDEHIEINWDNIPEKYKDQFNRTEWYEFTKYGLPYDYGSIMHYQSNRTKPMMTPKKDHYMGTIGSPMISFIDLSMINEHYYCKKICVDSGTKCENGGFPHPRNCSECICPGGYGGRLCDELPNDLGEVLNATSKWQNLYMPHYNIHKDLDYLKRTYWIKPTEENVKIEVNMTIINGNLDVPGCALAGVEIKNEEDKTVTGHRLCSTKDLGVLFESPCYSSSNSSHVVPVIFYSYRSPELMIVVGLNYRQVSCPPAIKQ